MYYITKYALTKGILSAEPEHTQLNDGTLYAYLSEGHCPGYWMALHEGEWFTTLEEAQLCVQKKVDAKLRILDRAVQKMKSYKATVNPVF